MNEWDEIAGSWDDAEAVQLYADAAANSLASIADKVGVDLVGSNACDFGCGTGLLTEHLVDLCASVDSIDTSPAMLEVLRAKIELRGWRNVCVLSELPSERQGYDLIVCSSVLSFVDDYAATVGALVRHLAVGGLFVQWDWELDPTDDEPHGLARNAVAAMLHDAGFSDIDVGVGFEVAVDGNTMSPIVGYGRRAR